MKVLRNVYLNLGIPTLYSSDYFGPGSDGLMLSRFGCIGSENSLSSCTFSFALDNCSNVNVAGVSCSSSEFQQHYDFYYPIWVL